MEIDLKRIPDKKYFSTIEVSKIVGIEAHTLRYWEKEFGSLFNVKKTSNQRIFKKNDIVNFLKIKSLIKKDRFDEVESQLKSTNHIKTILKGIN